MTTVTTETAHTTADTTAEEAHEAVFGFVGGLWQFKTLAAAVELGLFGALAGGQQATKEELEAALGLPERPADMLLAACTALGLLVKSGGSYRNSAMAETVLVPDSPDYCGGAVTYFDTRGWRGWSRLAEALRTDRPTTWDPDRQGSPFAAEDREMLGQFWHAIHNIGRSTARALGRAYDFNGHQRLLDVGAGSGCYPIELCRAYPHLKATCYDLPHVIPLTEGEVDKAGMTDRIATVAGDFFVDGELPGGHDVLLLEAVLHDWDEATGRMLLANCHDALPPGGVLRCSERRWPTSAPSSGCSRRPSPPRARSSSARSSSQGSTPPRGSPSWRAEFDAPDGAIHDEVATFQQGGVALLEGLIAAAQQHGELDSSVDPTQLAFELYAPLELANYFSTLHRDPAIVDRGRKAVRATLADARPRASAS